MRVLLAGASGAVGTPLIQQLITAGHQVAGITRTRANADRLWNAGVEPVVADVMDRKALLDALGNTRADAVVHQLTALKKAPMRHSDMRATNALRITGTGHLLAAARQVGAHRFLTQSIVLGYGFRDHGAHLITEDDPFAEPVPGPLGESLAALRATEEQVFSADEIEGISLRYGMFYGPDAGTLAMMAMLRKRQFPVPSGGGGLANFIHLSDAAAASVAALEKGRAGEAYNIVDEEPVRWGDFLDTAAARFGAPRPMRVPGLLLRVLPFAHAFMTTSMRVSNAKARRELGWAPAIPTYREGIEQIAAVTQ
jgi:nucleoside-diphosphate-sugar epimerase